MPTYTHETGWQRAGGKYMGRSMVMTIYGRGLHRKIGWNMKG